MKVSRGEDVASHSDPESCAGSREAAGEALTGESAGPVLSCEIRSFGAPTPLSEAEGNTDARDNRECAAGSTQSQTRSMRGNFLTGTWEVPSASTGVSGGSAEKGASQTLGMNAEGKSDECIVPMKPPNKGRTPAEVVEGRRSTEGNAGQPAAARTQSRTVASLGLTSVREVAKRSRKERFTALLHHIDVERLRDSFYALKRLAATGVDGISWQEYERGLEDRLSALHQAVHRGTYRAQPSRRVYIPKADGSKRPLGIAALEDKIVQQAVVMVLNAVYEADFVGFSYGFRPGRGQHDALDALSVGITERKVNWVLDADIRQFFDALDHNWMMRFVEHRIADPRILRLIRRWLGAGVMEDGVRSRATVGTPQGAVVSPLLANIYLHYTFDLWAHQWRARHAHGDVIVVRYADDTIVGFEHQHEAEQFLKALRERLQQFGLLLHPDKTRLIEFGRYAAERRSRRGESKPETFDFLGFTHICGRAKTGRYIVRRLTVAKRLRATLHAIRDALMRRRHQPVAEVGRWLRSVVRGYFNYHAVSGNLKRLDVFRSVVARHWLHALRRRSQRRRMPWTRFSCWVERWLPHPRLAHPYPYQRFRAKHPT